MSPPANSPNGTPPRISTAPSPYLEQLNVISSPVPDFAATLLNTSHEHNMEGTTSPPGPHELPSTSPVSALASHHSQQILSRIHSRQPYLTEDEFRHFPTESRRRMQRHLDASRHAPTASSYSNRSTHRQSLYDWAASESEESEDDGSTQQSVPLMPPEEPETSNDPDGWRDLEEALSTHRRRRNQSRREPGNNDPARRGATLQSWNEDLHVARERRSSAAARGNAHPHERELRREERIMSLLEGSQSQRLRHRASRDRILSAMEGFMADRDRRNQEREDASTSRSAYGATLHRSERVGEIVKESQRYSSSRVRNMVEYLSRVRACDLDNLDDTVALAMELDVAKNVEGDDIVAETRSIQPPPWTSLLTAGSTFTGSQHAPHDASGAHLLNRDRDYLRRMVANRNLSSAHLPGSIATLVDAERTLLNHPSTSHHAPTVTTRAQNRAPDHWPVSVALHSVDMDTLTITGTMSANHIPDKFSPNSPDHKPEGGSMKSYFEGEIIDMNKFTLETETYKHEGVSVDIETDVEYWKQLGPFREEVEKATQGVTKAVDAQFKADVQLASCLGSIEWVKRVIGQEWILMRWKERCFLPPSDTNSWGLTISGFYYIALKRDTGRIEGLYYDPGSQPYQRLDLVPEGSRSVHAAGVSGSCELGSAGVRKWFPSMDFGVEGYACAR